jgi:hypothetical protein
VRSRYWLPNATRQPLDRCLRRVPVAPPVPSANGFKSGRRGGYDYDYSPAKAKQPSDAAVSPNGAASAEETVPTAKG